ncbi:DUF1573 domain-containing protein [Pontibacter ruber]|uniref:DUF1573 domain-containing protein n=1 Tax=Pontibacter ruber TaxID=1343895 RepID=A0ABW5CZ73_9BACT|nr:DUF1573 domain-containing protein [Pontibacter ruber]
MKKNLFFPFVLAAGLLATSCDQAATTTDNAAAGEATATTPAEQPQQVANPNVAVAEEVTPSADAPVMSFKETEYDFGTIKQGEKVNHTFQFTNTGKTPLIIESASASCGCTAPDWTKTPVAPGQTGEVKVEFNSAGKFGQQSPTVTIRANTEPNIVRISMKGNVEGSSVPTAGAEGPVKIN